MKGSQETPMNFAMTHEFDVNYAAVFFVVAAYLALMGAFIGSL
jgi:hypothetical protein